MLNGHILIVTFPTQGQINPSLQLAKWLNQMGVKVTFATTSSAHHRIHTTARINFTVFSDGYDDGSKPRKSFQHYMSEIKIHSTQILREIIVSSSTTDHPITCLVYTLFLPWVAEVAREFHVPSALLWAQPASVFVIYYHYFNGYRDTITNHCNYPLCPVKLPGLPLLEVRDLPSFLLPSNSEVSTFSLQKFTEHFDALSVEENPKVLVNTFTDLEPDALSLNMGKLKLISIGPLIPSAFIDGKEPSDNSFGGDLFENSPENYIEWLNSKPEGSVVYVSFGSILVLPKAQREEIGLGLTGTRRPFLWVVREKEKDEDLDEERERENHELKRQGMVVKWCSQLEVLAHRSVGCYVTHCGWNSTVESLVAGVPMVAVPKWVDQCTNAKMVEDVWGVGIRVRVDEEEGFVNGDEIKRGIEMVMGGGERGEEMRKIAKKWKGLARVAMGENGSSYNNLQAFVQQVGEEHSKYLSL